MKRLTLMLRADDTARADIALTPDRTYYRLATDSSIEDGELAAVEADYDALAALPVAREGESALRPDMLVQVFADNRLSSAPVSEQGLRRLCDALAALAPEFEFVLGFRS